MNRDSAALIHSRETFIAGSPSTASADVATAESGMKYFQFEAAVLQVAYGFKKAWYELQLVDGRIRVSQEMVEWKWKRAQARPPLESETDKSTNTLRQG